MRYYALLALVVASAIAVHPSAAKAVECHPSPLKCPAGQTLYYSASNKACPSGNYLCRPALVAKPSVATTTPARTKPLPAKPIAAKPAAAKKPVAAQAKPRTSPPPMSDAEAERKLDQAKMDLEKLLSQVETPPKVEAPQSIPEALPKFENIPKRACVFNDTNLNDGRFIFAYESTSVAYGASCRHQIRTCIDGELSGSYTHAACSERSPEACVFNGSPIDDGGYVTAYQSFRAPAGLQCIAEIRFCENGTLSGSYAHATCTEEAPAVGEPYTGQSVLDFQPPPQNAGQQAHQAQQAAQEAQQRANLEAAQRAAEQSRQANQNAIQNAVQNAIRNAVQSAIPRIR